ncbi:hypothetical protein KC19_12G034200 [Ceratodon purpureus]|uniref:Uncharacterized protein n=1 Tax=Ceratodon purpureus TaxID=3225 RepID=A0A8T0G486_CERPU|nr:hypothetical protein KC19_12G034200 [Ceratodon purpureus]
MDEPQEFALEVVNNPLQGEPNSIKVGKQILPLTEPQMPIVWCGGLGRKCHDVTICLVPNEINRKSSEETQKYSEILTVLKVHSDRLSRCSKYFETCLTDRWTMSDSTFFLETVTDIKCYTDCFSRMYTLPSRKDFKNVKYSLRLLKVASQIEFTELMDSVCLYLSSKVWSETDEEMIRLYSASPDFPRKQAGDLVVRLGMDKSDDDCHKQFCDVMEQCFRTALDCGCGSFSSNRVFIEKMLLDSAPDNGPSTGRPAHFQVSRNVVMIVSRETKDMLVNFGQECDGKTFSSVPRFTDKVLAICWILETLLAAKVAEEVVQCFVHLHVFPKILAIEKPPPCRHGYENERAYNERYKEQFDARNAALKLGRVVFLMYRKVAAGKLLLKTPERVALLQNWHYLLKKLSFTEAAVLNHDVRCLFSTLPLKQQMELVKAGSKVYNYEGFIDLVSLAKRLKDKWPAVEEKRHPSVN